MRRVIGVVVAVALATGVFFLWPRSDETPTSMVAVTTTTPQKSTSTSSHTVTSFSSSGSTMPTSHVITTVVEAEEILRELWLGWFEGIYNQDEERIREVVATEHQLDLATQQFGTMSFSDEPSADDIAYLNTELLVNSEVCTVIYTDARFSGFTDGQTSDVHVLRWADGWKIFSLWMHQDDLWEGDCEAELSSG